MYYPMNILILNDTSKYHSGSFQVINFLKAQFKNHNVIFTKKARESYLKDIDLLIINGEGTMHDDAKKAKSMIDLAITAKQTYNTKLFLLNSVWQRNSPELTEKLKYFDYIGVREILSKIEINRVINNEVHVHLDLSFYNEVPWEVFDQKNVVAGNFYTDGKNTQLIKNIGEDSTIDIFNESWNTIVNKLRYSKILVTGRHHEMYAACKAKCPFIVLEGNTHKNSGLFKTFNINIPVLDQNASLDDIKLAIKNINLSEYYKLFEHMSNQSIPQFI